MFQPIIGQVEEEGGVGSIVINDVALAMHIQEFGYGASEGAQQGGVYLFGS